MTEGSTRTHPKRARFFQVSGSLLAYNAFLNLAGRTAPFLVGVVTAPYLVHGLGTERFGVLGMMWVVLGYFSIFDLGLSRAVVKFVLEVGSRGEAIRVPSIVWASAIAHRALGFVGAAVLAALAPLLAGRVLHIPQDLVEKATISYRLCALWIPLVRVPASFRSLL